MSYDPRPANRPHGASRNEASHRQQQQRIAGLPQRPDQLVSHYPSQSRGEQPRGNSPPQDGRPNGNTPSPTPQWPLSSSAEIPTSRHQGPQRSIRPVPDDHRDARPLTNVSVLSEASSLGDIPDFPVPVPPMPTVQASPRRQPSLGPPPSARRGPPSYYTQASYVSPIVEESESRAATVRSQRGSFASSNVFPTRDDSDYYQDDGLRSDGDTITSQDDKRHSTGSDDQAELVQPTLVRQASLGRRTKPSLTTIKSVDSFGERKPSLRRKPIPENDSASERTAAVGTAVLAAADGLAGRPKLGNSSVLLDPSSSEESSLKAPRHAQTRLADLDPDDIPDGDFEKDFEKEIMVEPTHPLQHAAKQTSLADRVGKRRPPRIDVDAVREAEARGSLTSLPELIRRATRLAANLDRGRTASRLGLDLWEAGAPGRGMRRSGSLSDMLAAFPPPGEATPTGTRTPRNGAHWPPNDLAEHGGKESQLSGKSNGRRRCCGMPMWTFVTLLVVLLFLIAAAVVIPVVLIVIPKTTDSQASAQATSTGIELPELPVPTGGSQPDQCDGLANCLNDGVAVFNADKTCNCVCINGFTGRSCEREGGKACTTMNIPGTADNATVGSGVARIFDAAQEDFGITLDFQTLLSLFSDNGLSCNTENALVTFNGLATRSVSGSGDLSGRSASRSPIELSLGKQEDDTLARRQTIGEVGPSDQENDSPTPTRTVQPTASPSAQAIPKNAKAIDFARIGVLLLLQETRDFDVAANAQSEIQNFLSDDSDSDSSSATIDLGPFDMDLVDLSFTFEDGRVIQARPGKPS